MLFGCDYSVCGSILIFAGVGFSVLSVFVSLANIAKARMDTGIITRPERAIAVDEEIEMPELKIYYASSYVAKRAILFFFISFLYLFGALADLFYIYSEVSHMFQFSLILIILSTILSTLIIGWITLKLFKRFVIDKKFPNW